MWHMRVMDSPIEFGTSAVIGNPARQVPTICPDIRQASYNIINACGHSKATEKIQHKRVK